LLVEVEVPPEIMAAKGLGACWLFSGPTNMLLLAPVFTGVSRVDCGTWTPVLGPFWGSNPVGVLPGLATLLVFEGFEALSDLEGFSDFRFDPVIGISTTFMLWFCLKLYRLASRSLKRVYETLYRVVRKPKYSSGMNNLRSEREVKE